MKKKLFLTLFLIMVVFENLSAQKQDYDLQVLQSVEMLNYISTLAERIKTNKSNRLELNEIRDEIYNNIIPLSIDETTQRKITGDNGFLDTIKEFELIGLQRKRLEYIAQQKKTGALKAAIPSPVLILANVQADNPVKTVASIVATVGSSYLNYVSTQDDVELQNMEKSWELDDKEYERFEDCRKETFDYMIEISRKYSLPQEYTLSEKNIKDFVVIMNTTNANNRLAELTKADNANLYTSAQYSPYYLCLIETYYELEKYSDCIRIFHEYENKNSRIFRKDYNIARLIPKIIYAAEKIYAKNYFTTFCEKYLAKLIQETDDKNWDLRYFASLMYYKLADVNPKNKNKYLKEAQTIILDIISYLALNQNAKLKEFLEPISKEIPKDIVKTEDIKSYKKMLDQLEKQREKELLPFDESFVLCINLFNTINNEYPLSKAKYKEKFLDVVKDSIVNKQMRKSLNFHKNGYELTYLGEKFKSETLKLSEEQTEVFGIWKTFSNLKKIATKKIKISLPLNYVTEDTKISLKFQTSDAENVVLRNVPFEIAKVIRPKKFNSSSSKKVFDSIENILVELVLDLKGYDLSIKDFDNVTFTLEAYGENISIVSENPEVQKRIEKAKKEESKKKWKKR